MAATNQYMNAAANTIYELNSDENIRELCRRRADYEAAECRNAEREDLILKLSGELATKDAALAEKDLIIAKLQAQLAQTPTP